MSSLGIHSIMMTISTTKVDSRIVDPDYWCIRDNVLYHHHSLEGSVLIDSEVPGKFDEEDEEDEDELNQKDFDEFDEDDEDGEEEADWEWDEDEDEDEDEYEE